MLRDKGFKIDVDVEIGLGVKYNNEEMPLDINMESVSGVDIVVK